MSNTQETQHPASGAGRTTPGAGFFQWIRSLGFVRGDDRWIAGVCGAVAARTGLDPIVVRGIAVVIAIFGGPIFFLYGAAWLLMPGKSGRIRLEELFQGRVEPATIAGIVVVALTFIPSFQGIWWRGVPDAWGMPGWLAATMSFAWTALVIGGLIWLSVTLVRWARDYARRGGPSASYYTAPADAGAQHAGTASSAPTDAAGSAADQATGATTGAASGPTAGPAFAPTSEPGGGPQPYGHHHGGPHPGWQHTAAAGQSYAAGAPGSPEWSREFEARQRERAEAARRRRPTAAFLSITMGLALIAAMVGGTVLAWGESALLVALCAALGVIGIAIIVLGIRGRASGALGFFATVGIVAVAIVGIAPAGTYFLPFGQANWATTDSASTQGFAVLAGQTNLDVTTMLAGNPSGSAETWMGAGQVNIQTPLTGRYVIDVRTLVGSVEFVSANSQTDAGGILVNRQLLIENGRQVDQFSVSTATVPTITVWQLVGQTVISINGAEAN